MDGPLSPSLLYFHENIEVWCTRTSAFGVRENETGGVGVDLHELQQLRGFLLLCNVYDLFFHKKKEIRQPHAKTRAIKGE